MKVKIGNIKGKDGKSAYECAVAGGYEGTEQEFNAEMASAAEKVSFTQQTLTKEQKAQARENIGATTEGFVNEAISQFSESTQELNELGRTFLNENDYVTTANTFCGFRTELFNVIISAVEIHLLLNADCVLTASVLDKNLTVLASKTLNGTEGFGKYKFYFGKEIKATTDRIYIELCADKKVVNDGCVVYNTTEFVSADNRTDEGGNWYSVNGGKWYRIRNASNKSSYTMRMVLYENVNVDNVYKGKFIYPETIYTVQNATKLKETMPQTLYIDHMVCLDSNAKTPNVKFEKTETDKFYVSSNVTALQSSDVIEENLDVKVSGVESVDSFQVKHISTKSNVGNIKPVRLLQIGDSVGGAFGGNCNLVNYFGDNPHAYWAVTQKLFDLDAIREADTSLYKMQCLGFRNVFPYQVKYNNQTYDARNAYGEGRGGWKLYDYLYHGIQGETGTDREPTSAQPINPFYDKDKVWSGLYADELNNSGVKFSLQHYLNEYRTHDDDGNELEVGNGTGNSVHSSGTNDTSIGYIVKGNAFVNTPTHILQENAFNDDVADFVKNTELFIKAVRNEFPEIVIGIVLNDSAFGYFPQHYKEYSMGDWMDGRGNALHKKQFDRYVALRDMINAFNDDKVYLLPLMFIQPTLAGCHTEDYTNADGSIAKYVGSSGTYHPNNVAHSAWGSQLYAWLKYTLT